MLQVWIPASAVRFFVPKALTSVSGQEEANYLQRMGQYPLGHPGTPVYSRLTTILTITSQRHRLPDHTLLLFPGTITKKQPIPLKQLTTFQLKIEIKCNFFRQKEHGPLRFKPKDSMFWGLFCKFMSLAVLSMSPSCINRSTSRNLAIVSD